jgi:Flp pilus assembly protein CpaB
MKALQNKTVVTILAGIICVAILAISYYNRVNKKISAVPVPIAKVDLVAREQITADKIDSIKVASSAITKNVLRDTKDIEKKYVNYNTKIPKGSFFYTNAVVDWSVMPDAAWSEISDDTTIVSLPVNNRSTYGNSIYPGDKIDLYYRTQDKGLLVYGKLIEGITVLAVKDSQGYHINQKSASQKDAVALIFNVPEDQHLLLRKALYLDGSGLIPVPRNAAYSQSDIEANISSEYLKGLINNRCKEVPLDTVANNNTTNVKVTE